jgi:hydroxymethylbilane synthase
MRGNVDTRLRKVDAGECDAIVLARATEVLAPEVSLPAVGQGALGIECREDDAATRTLLARAHDAETSLCVAAERGVLVALEGDCKTPLAAHARRIEDRMLLRAFAAEPDGTRFRTSERDTPWPSTDAEATDIGLNLGRALR